MKAVRKCRATQARRASPGAAIIEFALTCVVFFTLVAAIVDFGYLFWANLTMQHAVREGARVAVVGREDLDPDPTPGNSMQNRFDSAVEEMQEQSMGLWTQVSPVVSVSVVDDAGHVTALPANNIGAPSQIIVISVDCAVPMITGFMRPFFPPDGIYRFRVSATMRNEAFS